MHLVAKCGKEEKPLLIARFHSWRITSVRASPIVWKNDLLSLFIWKKKKNPSPIDWNRTCYIFATWKTSESRADVSALGVAWNPGRG
jgi:hypothetical protein